MRLSTKQVSAILQAVKRVLGNIPFELYLFGSRVRDDLKGGDIDLALKLNPSDKQFAQERYLDLLVQIKSGPSIGERRIDLKLLSARDIDSDPFLQQISENWILLQHKE